METDISRGKRLIKDLTQRELNIIYSLVRIGDWPAKEIGRIYKLSEENVGRVFDNYAGLLEAVENSPPVEEQLHQDPSQERIEKPRKRRFDARYATTAERQAAYRMRLKEKRRSSLEQPSSSNETDSPRPDGQEPSVTVCEAPVPEIGPEEAVTQHSARYSSSVEGCDISESTPLPVTTEACSEREELRVIEELR